MKFRYTFTKKDYIQFLKDSNKKYNYICLFIFTIFYFGACFDLLTANFMAIFISFVVSVIILYALLKLVTTIYIKFMVSRNDKLMKDSYGLYDIEITSEQLIEKVEGNTFTLRFEDVYRVQKNDKWCILYPKNSKIMYFFIKKLFDKEETYHKAVNMIVQNVEKKQVALEKKENGLEKKQETLEEINIVKQPEKSSKGNKKASSKNNHKKTNSKSKK